MRKEAKPGLGNVVDLGRRRGENTEMIVCVKDKVGGNGETNKLGVV